MKKRGVQLQLAQFFSAPKTELSRGPKESTEPQRSHKCVLCGGRKIFHYIPKPPSFFLTPQSIATAREFFSSEGDGETTDLLLKEEWYFCPLCINLPKVHDEDVKIEDDMMSGALQSCLDQLDTPLPPDLVPENIRIINDIKSHTSHFCLAQLILKGYPPMVVCSVKLPPSVITAEAEVKKLVAQNLDEVVADKMQTRSYDQSRQKIANEKESLRQKYLSGDHSAILQYLRLPSNRNEEETTYSAIMDLLQSEFIKSISYGPSNDHTILNFRESFFKLVSLLASAAKWYKTGAAEYIKFRTVILTFLFNFLNNIAAQQYAPIERTRRSSHSRSEPYKSKINNFSDGPLEMDYERQKVIIALKWINSIEIQVLEEALYSLPRHGGACPDRLRVKYSSTSCLDISSAQIEELTEPFQSGDSVKIFEVFKSIIESSERRMRSSEPVVVENETVTTENEKYDNSLEEVIEIV